MSANDFNKGLITGLFRDRIINSKLKVTMINPPSSLTITNIDTRTLDIDFGIDVSDEQMDEYYKSIYLFSAIVFSPENLQIDGWERIDSTTLRLFVEDYYPTNGYIQLIFLDSNGIYDYNFNKIYYPIGMPTSLFLLESIDEVPFPSIPTQILNTDLLTDTSTNALIDPTDADLTAPIDSIDFSSVDTSLTLTFGIDDSSVSTLLT